MSWTDERIERLKKMWHEGATASQIADDLGGVSRNAVIGKAHRLGLEQRPSPVKAGRGEGSAEAGRHARRARRRPRPRPRQPSADAPVAPPTAAAGPHAVAPHAPDARPSCSIARSAPAASFARVRASSRRRSRPRRRAAWCRPSRAPRSPTRPALLDLNDRICKWPIGHPGEPDFHFCGDAANPGFPYCVEHCGVAYQAQLPRRDRRPPPPLPFGGPRVR